MNAVVFQRISTTYITRCKRSTETPCQKFSDRGLAYFQSNSSTMRNILKLYSPRGYLRIPTCHALKRESSIFVVCLIRYPGSLILMSDNNHLPDMPFGSCSFEDHAKCASILIRNFKWSNRKICPLECSGYRFHKTAVQVEFISQFELKIIMFIRKCRRKHRFFASIVIYIWYEPIFFDR